MSFHFFPKVLVMLANIESDFYWLGFLHFSFKEIQGLKRFLPIGVKSLVGL
jgi:hypothetical protein